MVGSELAPLAATHDKETVTSVVGGTHEDEPPLVTSLLKQVSRKKMELLVMIGETTRLGEIDAKAMNSPVWLEEGPEVVSDGVPLEQGGPQMPLVACAPVGARSAISGSPDNSVPLTENG